MMIDQVLALHPHTRRFHIGADEVKDNIYKKIINTCLGISSVMWKYAMSDLEESRLL